MMHNGHSQPPNRLSDLLPVECFTPISHCNNSHTHIGATSWLWKHSERRISDLRISSAVQMILWSWNERVRLILIPEKSGFSFSATLHEASLFHVAKTLRWVKQKLWWHLHLWKHWLNAYSGQSKKEYSAKVWMVSKISVKSSPTAWLDD